VSERHLRGVSGVLLAAGLALLANGLWIPAKAELAQHLLRRAWERTLASGGTQRFAPWPWADTWPVARLLAPAQDVDLVVLAGASGRTLAFGPGHHAGSAALGAGPGAPGVTVLAGHRDTHFRFLGALRPGDELRVQTPDGRWRRYRVLGHRVVDARDARLLAEPAAALALVTCFPFDAPVPGGPLRYVVWAEPIDEEDA
jgi:sortase A